MGIHRFVLTGITILPVFFTVNGMAKPLLAEKSESEKAITSPNPKEAENAPGNSPREHGTLLTPLGAEKDGNADSTIPPWTGGITSPPVGYKKGDHHPDPYPEDKILFTISSANLDAYKDRLSAGQIALMQKYPLFKMNVYPTRRSASLPQRIYDATIANKKTAQLTKNGNAVTGAIGGIPFPTPKNGQEAIWNHLMRYRGDAVLHTINHAVVTTNGNYTLIKTEDDWYFHYYKSRNPHNALFCCMQSIKAPPSVAGIILLLEEPLDITAKQRSVWQYLPGQRRVTRLPDVSYDYLFSAVEGLRTIDQYDMFMGAIDRYAWKLLGKRELYVPYNAYKLHSSALKYTDILKPGHINTEYARYELHRVWVVDAAVKEGMKHLYPHRTFYLDEDSWQILIEDIYDEKGRLWRVSEGHVINYYEVPVISTTLEVRYDLQSGRYIAEGLDNEDRMYDFSIKRDPGDYTPAAMRRLGKR